MANSAGKVGGVIGIAAAFVERYLGPGAYRMRPVDHVTDLVFRHDHIRRLVTPAPGP